MGGFMCRVLSFCVLTVPLTDMSSQTQLLKQEGQAHLVWACRWFIHVYLYRFDEQINKRDAESTLSIYLSVTEVKKEKFICLWSEERFNPYLPHARSCLLVLTFSLVFFFHGECLSNFFSWRRASAFFP